LQKLLVFSQGVSGARNPCQICNHQINKCISQDGATDPFCGFPWSRLYAGRAVQFRGGVRNSNHFVDELIEIGGFRKFLKINSGPRKDNTKNIWCQSASMKIGKSAILKPQW